MQFGTIKRLSSLRNVVLALNFSKYLNGIKFWSTVFFTSSLNQLKNRV